MGTGWKANRKHNTSHDGDCFHHEDTKTRRFVSSCLCGGEALEVDSAVDDEPARSRGGGDTAKRISAVDVRNGIAEVRMVQDIDCIDPEFEFLGLVDLEPLDKVHIESKTPWSLQRRQTERSNFTRLRIYEYDLAIGSDDRFVAISRVQTIQCRDARQSGIRDLRESVEVNDTVCDLRDMAHVLWKRTHDIWLRRNVADGLRTVISSRSRKRDAVRIQC